MTVKDSDKAFRGKEKEARISMEIQSLTGKTHRVKDLDGNCVVSGKGMPMPGETRGRWNDGSFNYGKQHIAKPRNE